MTKTVVDKIMCAPLSYDCGPDICGSSYSKQDTPTADYDRRWIRYDLTEKVIETIREFYID